MRKLISYVLVFMCITLPLRASPPSYDDEDDTPGDFFNGAKYDSATHHSIAISMITWGLGIAAGITALTLLVSQSATKHKSSHDHSTSH